jgi:hypothetical protein
MKHSNPTKYGIAALPLVLLIACSVPGSQTPSSSVTSPPSVLISNYNGTFSYTVDAGTTAKDVYFVFSNTNLDTTAGAATVTNSVGTIKVDGTEIAASSAQPAGGPSASSTSAKDFLANSNRDPVNFIASHPSKVQASRVGTATPSYDNFGDPGNLYSLDSSDNLTTVSAHCQLVRGPITTAQGSRTLNIWVENDCMDPAYTYGGGNIGTGTGQKRHLITVPMVKALADAFLKDGSGDIYTFDTNILGPEWGATSASALSSNLISNTNGNITILLADIEQDNSDIGGIVGYFDPTNNFLSSYYSASNQRIMFVIDSVMFANPSPAGATGTGTEGWDASTSYWAKFCFSTLAHEFQHMIQFYRKGILVRGDGQSADTWINEMCSQLMEDLVADKLHVPGPRGVEDNPTAGSSGNTDGRIPYFNKYLSKNYALNKTSDYGVYDYSFSYAFGSWLMRNYGGAGFMKNVVYDSATDSTCITNAVSKATGRSETMADLISRWAVAVLGSSRQDMPPGYIFNTGAWTSSSGGGMNYNLGSINFFNYDPAPQVLTATGSVPRGSIATASNVYYRAGSSLTGSKTWNLVVPQGVGFSVFVSPHAP